MNHLWFNKVLADKLACLNKCNKKKLCRLAQCLENSIHDCIEVDGVEYCDIWVTNIDKFKLLMIAR